jgi:hypothetical protein
MCKKTTKATPLDYSSVDYTEQCPASGTMHTRTQGKQHELITYDGCKTLIVLKADDGSTTGSTLVDLDTLKEIRDNMNAVIELLTPTGTTS